MPRFTLVVLDRYDSSESEILYLQTEETDLKKAFRKALEDYYGNDYYLELHKLKIKEAPGNEEHAPFVCWDLEEHAFLFF